MRMTFVCSPVGAGHRSAALGRHRHLKITGIRAIIAFIGTKLTVGLDRRRYFHWLLRRIRLCIRLRRIRLIDFCHLVIDHGIVVAEFMFVGNDN